MKQTPSHNSLESSSVVDKNLDALIAEHLGRIVCSNTIKESTGAYNYKLSVALKKQGVDLLTEQECPSLLGSDQMLLWPTAEPLPTVNKTMPPTPAYDALDGRRFTPTKALHAPELANTLFEGDCLQILPLFPSSSVDMILCDLPYGTTQNKWDAVIPLTPLWQEYKRIIKPNGAIVLTAQGAFTAKLIMSNEKWFKYKIVWEKSKPTNFLNAKKQPLRKHEDICVFYKHQPTYNPQMSSGEPYDKGVRKQQLSGSYGDFLPVHVKSEGECYPTDIVYFTTAESEGPVWHPTQKPVALGQYLIKTFTTKGALVLDNAFGSGSFLVAAAIEGRRYVGIERNQGVHLFKHLKIDYVGVAKQRLQDVTK